MRRFAIILCVTFAAGLTTAGCSIDLPTVGCGGRLQSGRSISVTSDRPYRSFRSESVGPNTESIQLGTFSPRRILVAPTDVEVDGTRVATIPEETKSVTVAEEDGRLRIAADGTTVYDAKF